MDGWNTIVSYWGPAYFQWRLLLVSEIMNKNFVRYLKRRVFYLLVPEKNSRLVPEKNSRLFGGLVFLGFHTADIGFRASILGTNEMFGDFG